MIHAYSQTLYDSPTRHIRHGQPQEAVASFVNCMVVPCKLQWTVGVAGVGSGHLGCNCITRIYLGFTCSAMLLHWAIHGSSELEQRFRGSISTLSEAALKVLSEFYSKSFVQLSEDRHLEQSYPFWVFRGESWRLHWPHPKRYIYIYWAPRVFRAPHICMICTFGLSSWYCKCQFAFVYYNMLHERLVAFFHWNSSGG